MHQSIEMFSIFKQLNDMKIIYLGVAESSTNRPVTSNTSLATSASLSPTKNNLTNKRRFNSQECILQQNDVMNKVKIAKL